MLTTNKYTIIASITLLLSIMIDIVLSVTRYPIITIAVCGIVVVLGYVTPHIRKSY